MTVQDENPAIQGGENPSFCVDVSRKGLKARRKAHEVFLAFFATILAIFA